MLASSCSSPAMASLRSRKMLKSVGERGQPFHTPTVVWNHSPMELLRRTVLLAFVYSCQ